MIKLKKKTKKQLRAEAKFNTAVLDHMRSRGARDNDIEGWKNMYSMVIDTQVGPLIFNTNDTWVAMRFVDVERANSVLPHGYGDRLNRYSGKYNIHFGADGIHDVEYCLKQIDRMLEPVIHEAA